jgi:hypothetical protein
MPKPVDLSFIDEAVEDPAELLKALPEVRYEVEAATADDDLGIRSLLERPEVFSHPWWRDQARRGSGRSPFPRRPGGVVSASYVAR